MEYWSIGIKTEIHHSITPKLQKNGANPSSVKLELVWG
jgi:hypothetical protein